MKNNRYSDWIKTQSPEFIKEIHGVSAPVKFYDRCREDVDLEQLRELDEKYNNPED